MECRALDDQTIPGQYRDWKCSIFEFLGLSAYARMILSVIERPTWQSFLGVAVAQGLQIGAWRKQGFRATLLSDGCTTLRRSYTYNALIYLFFRCLQSRCSHYIRKGVGICILLGRLREHGVRSRVSLGRLRKHGVGLRFSLGAERLSCDFAPEA